MKRSFYLVLFCFLMAHANAQTFTAIKAGASLSNLKYKIATNLQARVTWHAGFMANFDVQDQFFVRTEFLYSLRGYKAPATASAAAVVNHNPFATASTATTAAGVDDAYPFTFRHSETAATRL